MVGINTAVIPDSITLREMGTDVLPATSGEVFGASFGEGLAENLTPRMMRSAGRFTATTGITGVDDFGRPIQGEAEPLIDTETANQQYGIKGHLSFDQPVPQSVAKDLFEHKRAQLDREDTIARRESGLLTGGAARFTAALAAGTLDPLNLAVGFIPVIGPAREALLLEQAATAAGRAGIRAGIGAASGAAGMAALQPFEFGLSQQEHEDYTMAMALRSVALGTVLGGGLHAGVGAVVDRATGKYRNPLTQRLEEAGPEARETLLQGALAQHLEERPVEVAPALDAFDAARAESELVQFARQQQQIEARADAALGRITETEGQISAARPALDAAHARLTELRQRSETLRGELEQARQQSAAAIDTVTQQRLATIEQELAGNPPSARRASLESERQMLTEGAKTTPAADALEQARAEAQATGLSAALRRSDREAAKLENRLSREQAKAGAQETATTRAFGLESARISSQQAIIRDLAERSIRRLAGRAGVTLGTDEAATLARRILGAESSQAEAATREALASLLVRAPNEQRALGPADRLRRIDTLTTDRLAAEQGERAAGSPSRSFSAIAAGEMPATEPLRESWRQSMGELLGIARRPPETSDIMLAAREAAKAPNDELQAIERHNAELEARHSPAGAENAAEPGAVDPVMELAEARARAYERAGACLTRGG